MSKALLRRIGKSGGFLGRNLGPFQNIGLYLIENVLKPLAKSALISLGSIAAASATDEATRKKLLGSVYVTLIISNKEMNDIMKIVKSLEEIVLLINLVRKAIKNEAKEQKGGFLGMLLGTLRTNLVGNLSTGKGKIEHVKEELVKVRIFNSALSFKKFWNTKVLSKWY